MAFPNVNPKTTLYVSGLDESATQESLHAAFITFGDIVSIQLPPDHRTGQHRGFAFVEFETSEDAGAAIENMHLSEMFGKTIKVSLARPGKGGPAFFSLKPIWAQDGYMDAVTDTADNGTMDMDVDKSNEGAASAASGKVPGAGLSASEPKSGDASAAAGPGGTRSWKIFMDISIGGTPAGRLILQLRPDVCPKTCENFR